MMVFCLYYLNISGLKLPIESFVLLAAELGRNFEAARLVGGMVPVCRNFCSGFRGEGGSKHFRRREAKDSA